MALSPHISESDLGRSFEECIARIGSICLTRNHIDQIARAEIEKSDHLVGPPHYFELGTSSYSDDILGETVLIFYSDCVKEGAKHQIYCGLEEVNSNGTRRFPNMKGSSYLHWECRSPAIHEDDYLEVVKRHQEKGFVHKPQEMELMGMHLLFIGLAAAFSATVFFLLTACSDSGSSGGSMPIDGGVADGGSEVFYGSPDMAVGDSHSDMQTVGDPDLVDPIGRDEQSLEVGSPNDAEPARDELSVDLGSGEDVPVSFIDETYRFMTLDRVGSMADAIAACRSEEHTPFWTILAIQDRISASIFIEGIEDQYIFDNVLDEGGTTHSWQFDLQPDFGNDPIVWSVSGLPTVYSMNQFFCVYDANAANDEYILCTLDLGYSVFDEESGMDVFCVVTYQNIWEI